MNGWHQILQTIFFKVKFRKINFRLESTWIKALGIYGGLSWILFGNPVYVLMWSPSCYLYAKRKSTHQNQLQMRQVMNEFVDFLDYFNISVMSGYSMENSIMAYIHQCRNSSDEILEGVFFERFEMATKRLQMGGTIKSFLYELEHRFDINEIKFFSMCLSTGISLGGDLKEMVYETSRQIKQKIVMEQEILAIVAEKKMEVAIMGAMPYGVLIMMKYTMAEMMVPLFHTWQGWLTLFSLFMFFEGARVIGDRIIEIQL